MRGDPMRNRGASRVRTLPKPRSPPAAPFVPNGMKPATTPAPIGAVVAEYFGSPIKGMGVRVPAGGWKFVHEPRSGRDRGGGLDRFRRIRLFGIGRRGGDVPAPGQRNQRIGEST